MMQKTLTTQRSSHVCRVNPRESGNNKPFTGKSKETLDKFYKKRTVTLKENVNELLKISQVDMNEIAEFARELDAFHKSKFDDLKANFNDKTKKNCNEKTELTESPSKDESATKEEDGSEENIFLEK
jgi:hypothetical protein